MRLTTEQSNQRGVSFEEKPSECRHIYEENILIF
jgi:hypothetical protein